MKAERKHRGPGENRRRGAALVEFAVVVPVLILFLLAFFELANALMIDSVVENAAYEGARRGIIPGARVADVHEAADGIAKISSLRSVDIRVEPAPIRLDTSEITVIVRAPLNKNGLIIGSFLGDRVLERQVSMIRESSLRYQFKPDVSNGIPVSPRPRRHGASGRESPKGPLH